jgi:hypothetical protein
LSFYRSDLRASASRNAPGLHLVRVTRIVRNGDSGQVVDRHWLVSLRDSRTLQCKIGWWEAF